MTEEIKKELRLGNYLKDDTGVLCTVSRIETEELTEWNGSDVSSIICKIVNTKNRYIEVENDAFVLVELTTEILEKCGFKCFKNSNVSSHFCIKDNPRIDIEIIGELFYVQLLGTVVKKVTYLHELQNIYYALTAQELNIEL